MGFIVLRIHPDLAGFVPPDLDGRWIEVTDPPPAECPWNAVGVAVFNGRFERRSDGATARVYEFRP